MTVLWWHWLALGLILVALEVTALGGVYVAFFGVSAIVLSFLTAVGLVGPLWFQLVLFAVLALLMVFVLREPLIRRLKIDRPDDVVDSLVGEIALPIEAIAAGAVGRAELRGSIWTARSAGAPLARGQRCRVTSVEHLLIVLEPEGAN